MEFTDISGNFHNMCIVDDINKLINGNESLIYDDNLKQNLIYISSKMKKWEQDFEVLRQMYRAREEDVDTLFEVKDKLILKNQALESKIVNLECENNILKNIVKKQVEFDENEIVKLNEKINRLNNQIYKLTTENIKLKNRNEKMKSDYQNEKNEMIHMHNEDKSNLDSLIDILDILIEDKKKREMKRFDNKKEKKNEKGKECTYVVGESESESESDSDIDFIASEKKKIDEYEKDSRVEEFNQLCYNVSYYFELILSAFVTYFLAIIIYCVFINY